MKFERIRLIYAIFLSAFVVAVGLAFICVAADIYFTGKDTGVIYSQAIVAGRLKAFIAPIVLLIAAIIAGGVVFPLYEVKAKRKSEDTLKKLQARKPSGGEGEEFDRAEKQYTMISKIRLIVWISALVVTLVCVIVSLCYVCDASHFPAVDVTEEIFAMVKYILPFVIVAFVVICAAAIYNGIATEKQLKELKTMIKHGNGEVTTKTEPAAVAVAKEVAAHKATLWSVRGAVFVIAVAFIIAGAINGGAHDVLIKAINICQECIGLG